MKRFFIIIIFIFTSLALHTEQWQILGTRPMGMGGAYVAMAKGPIAQYWNPAGLAQKSTQTFSGLEIPCGVGIEATGGILDNVTKITEVAKQIENIRNSEILTNQDLGPQEVSAFMKSLALLEDINKKDSGALVEIAGGVNLKLSKLAFSINNFTSVGLNPWIDTLNIGIVNTTVGENIPSASTQTPTTPVLAEAAGNLTQAINIVGFDNIKKIVCGTSDCLSSKGITDANSLANTLVNSATTTISQELILEASKEALKYAEGSAAVIQNYAANGGNFSANTSRLDVVAASFNEAAIGYAKYLSFLPGLAIGGNIKIIQGNITSKRFYILEEEKTRDVFKDVLENKKTSVRPAVDIGLLWDVNERFKKIPFSPKLGFTIRNINSPKFDASYGDKYQLDRQIRMGLALSPFSWWHFAADIDITKNKTAVDGFKSRQLSVGTEINILNRKSFNLPLRLGFLKNLAEDSSKTIYTAGIGLTFAYLHIDLAAGISSGKQNIDNHKYPEKAQAVASVGLLF